MSHLQLPPERDLPEPDAMLGRILADDPVVQRRPSRAVPLALAAGVGVLALGVGVAVVRPWTPGPVDPGAPASGPVTGTTQPAVSPSQPPTPASPDPSRSASGAPSTTSNTPAARPSASIDANGVAHFTGPGTAVFPHFKVTVGDAPQTMINGRWARQVTVCVVTLGKNPVDGKHRLSWDPWSLSQDGSARAKATSGTRYQPAYPSEVWHAPGECATGMISFVADPSSPATLTYRNAEYGETAVWEMP